MEVKAMWPKFLLLPVARLARRDRGRLTIFELWLADPRDVVSNFPYCFLKQYFTPNPTC
jgi:hypothetical protein